MFEPSPCEKNGKSGKSHAACSSLGAHQKQAQPQTPLAMKGEQRRCSLQPASQWSSWHKKNTCSESLKLRDTPKYLQNISKIIQNPKLLNVPPRKSPINTSHKQHLQTWEQKHPDTREVSSHGWTCEIQLWLCWFPNFICALLPFKSDTSRGIL